MSMEAMKKAFISNVENVTPEVTPDVGVTDKSQHEWSDLTPEEFNEINETSTTVGYAIILTERMLREKNA